MPTCFKGIFLYITKGLTNIQLLLSPFKEETVTKIRHKGVIEGNMGKSPMHKNVVQTIIVPVCSSLKNLFLVPKLL